MYTPSVYITFITMKGYRDRYILFNIRMCMHLITFSRLLSLTLEKSSEIFIELLRNMTFKYKQDKQAP